MADVFCNNCGHKNPLGANFCSSCGTPLEQELDDPTTITFQVEGAGARVPTTTSPSISTTSRPTAACWSSCAVRSPAPASRSPRTSPPPAATRRPTCSSTTSRCRAATPSSCGPARASGSATSGSLNGTYLNRERVDDARPDQRRRDPDRQLQAGVLRRALTDLVSESTLPHLSIGEVLALLQPEFPDVTISKIRFLESQGLLDPERTPSGYRKFYDDDIARLRWILTQQRDHFLPLKVIKDRLAEATAVGGRAPTTIAGRRRGRGAAPSRRLPPRERRGRRPRVPSRRATGLPSPMPSPAGPRNASTRARRQVLDSGPSDLSFTAAELAGAAGMTEREIERLESFGLLDGRTIGREVIYDGDALVVARLAAAFLERGLEPRHLRMFKVAAEREAGVYEQLVTPLTRQRNPESRRRGRAPPRRAGRPRPPASIGAAAPGRS